MRLIDCLQQQEMGRLKQLAAVYRCECNPNSKLEIMQSVHHRLLNIEALSQIVNLQDDGLRAYLHYLVFQHKNKFTWEELQAKARLVHALWPCAGSPQHWIDHLLEVGCLFVTRDAYQKLFWIPSDVHRLLRRLAEEEWLNKLQPAVEDQLDEAHHLPTVLDVLAIVKDLLIFLRLLAEQPIPLTKGGVIHKRAQRTLFNAFLVQEHPLPKLRWRFGYGRRFPNYPNRFSLIYDYCYQQGWICETEHWLLLTAEGEQIVSAPPSLLALRRDLICFWLKLYSRPIPTLPFLYRLLTVVLKAKWIPMDQLLIHLSPWLRPYYFDDQESLIKERILGMMESLGLLRIMVDQALGRVYVGMEEPKENDLLQLSEQLNNLKESN